MIPAEAVVATIRTNPRLRIVLMFERYWFL